MRFLAMVAGLLVAPAAAIMDLPPWQAPAPLPQPALFADGIISTGQFESHPCFTPDGHTFYFVRSTPQFTDWTIWVTHFVDGRWAPPVVAPFSGTYRDADPFITADGGRLYFISDRPVNSVGNEWFPTVAASGNLYFGSDRPGGHGATDLYISFREKDAWSVARNLGPVINRPGMEISAYLSPDGKSFFFSSCRWGEGVKPGE